MAFSLLALSVALVAAAPPQPPWPSPLPAFASSWFGGSLDYKEWQNPSQMAQLSQYKAILTSWILPTNHTFTNATAIASEQAVKLKEAFGANGTTVFTYQSGILAPAFYPENKVLMDDPATYGDFFLRQNDGSFMSSETYCSQTHTTPAQDPGCLSYMWNWCNESAIDWYVHKVLGGMVTDSSGKGLNFDGVFLDNSDEFNPRGSSNGACDAHNATMSVHIETAKFFQSVGKWPIFSTTNSGASMQAEADLLWAAGAGFSKFWESWNPSLGAIVQLYNETEYGLPTVVHATSHGWPFERKPAISLNDSLASFLVATGGAPHSYFQYSSGWYDSDFHWSPLFGQKYGTAVAPPTITKYGNMSAPGEIWERKFSTGVVASVNCTPPDPHKFAWCKGSITFP
eukprot:m.88084 g.88084  ORF g.88084 m.88084 type:complete len:399 (+) comp13141_c0_seq3:51-1247(+)